MISYTPPRHLLFKCMFTATTDSRSLLWRAILSKPFIKWWSISHTIGKLNEYTNLSKTSITYYEKKIQQLYGIVAMLTKYLSLSRLVLSICRKMCSSSATTSPWTCPTMVRIYPIKSTQVISHIISYPLYPIKIIPIQIATATRYEGHPPRGV